MSKRKPKIKPVLIRFDEDQLGRLDAWCQRQNVSPTRADVIRAAVDRWLADDGSKDKCRSEA
jgi:hypothetical protein